MDKAPAPFIIVYDALRIANLAQLAALLGRDESTLRESVERYLPSE